jgi:hypothetical protein
MRRLLVPAAILCAAVAAGCAPSIGDSCSNSTNCSVNGDRQCDLSQPGGYCIVFDCQPDRCPNDAVCVRFSPDEPRHSVVACMRRCSSDGDCRSGDGYRCRGAAELPPGFAEVTDLDPPDGRFCIFGVE